MSESCSHDCSLCSSECGERERAASDLWEKPHELSKIKKVFAVVSGKGGVGKTLVTSLLAVSMNRLGLKTAILDADITGPSIPRAFGLRKKAEGSELGVYPVKTATGISVMSLNLLLPNETDPVVWRGPIVASTVKQFWTDVIWDEVDCLLIDMPPGTGDVPLTVFQSIPVDGVIVVTSPQELVAMIVEKAVNMARLMHIPVIGLVENFSYFRCPTCGTEHQIFGESHVDEIAADQGIRAFVRLPIDPELVKAVDSGTVERFEADWVDDLASILKGEVQ